MRNSPFYAVESVIRTEDFDAERWAYYVSTSEWDKLRTDLRAYGTTRSLNDLFTEELPDDFVELRLYGVRIIKSQLLDTDSYGASG